MNKRLLASFMIQMTSENFVSGDITFTDLDPWEVDMLCATGGIVTTIQGSKVFITPNLDKTAVVCLEVTPFHMLLPIKYEPSWEELSDILEKEHYQPIWEYPNLPNLPEIDKIIDAYLATHKFS